MSNGHVSLKMVTAPHGSRGLMKLFREVLTHLWVIPGSYHGSLRVGLELGNHLC